MEDRNRIAAKATVPIVVAIPAVSDNSTSATIGPVLCTQAKPSTEIAVSYTHLTLPTNREV